VAVEQSTLRSVDSEWAGRVIEPRNCVVAGVDTVQIVEDNTEAQQWPSAEVPPWVGEHGMYRSGGQAHRVGKISERFPARRRALTDRAEAPIDGCRVTGRELNRRDRVGLQREICPVVPTMSPEATGALPKKAVI
jgi:hypothetical protein